MNDPLVEQLKTIKKQADEIEKRGKIIMDLEEQIKIMQENIIAITKQNRQLEMMVEVAKQERVKFLEDNQELEEKVKNNSTKLPPQTAAI
jgi:hypothetical protein